MSILRDVLTTLPRRAHRSLAGMLLLFAAMCPVVAFGGSAPEAHATPPEMSDGSGIHVENVNWIDDRKVDLTVSTSALPMPVHVLVIVPTDYLTNVAARYPSIYLLNGCNAGHPYTGLEYMGWEAGLHVEASTTSVPAIFVMPEGGAGGFYTNWKHAGTMGAPQWETFHIDQLIPWIDQNFRTIADRAHRGIMGISMGGFGSLSYPARHPDLFSAAASLSGAADLTNPAAQAEPASGVVVQACAASDGGDANSTFGSHTEDELNSRAHDPAQLVQNYSNTRLYLYTGTGDPGPLDPPGATHDGIEGLAHEATIGFMAALQAAGGSAYLDDYGPGTHTVPYWIRDFADVLPRFMADFTNPQTVSTFTYKTELPTYDLYGFHVQITRAADEFSIFSSHGAQGFSLQGSGSAQVTTDAHYTPNAPYRMTLTLSSGQSQESVVYADALGRISVAVPLGPSNPATEFLGDAVTNVFTTNVTIAAINAPVTTIAQSSTTMPESSTTNVPTTPQNSVASSQAQPAAVIERQPQYTG